jgi:hypothetical protein
MKPRANVVNRCKQKISDLQRDVVDKAIKVSGGSKQPTKEDIASAIFNLEHNFGGY